MDKEFEDIKKLFEERDDKAYMESMERACQEAINSRKEERITRKKQMHDKFIGTKIVTIVLGGLLLVGGAKLITEKESSNNDVQITMLSDDLSMKELGKEIGSLVYVKGDNFNEKFDTTLKSILSQCTYRTSDNESFYYSHTEIARKILSLDEDLREYALCSVLNDMGVYRTAEFEKGKTNADYLLKNISMFESDNEIKLLDGTTSLEEYLKMKGFVDKDGNASFEMFVEKENQNAPIIKEIVESLMESKGVRR